MDTFNRVFIFIGIVFVGYIIVYNINLKIKEMKRREVVLERQSIQKQDAEKRRLQYLQKEEEEKKKRLIEKEEIREKEEILGIKHSFMEIPEYIGIDGLNRLIEEKEERDERLEIERKQKYSNSYQYIYEQYFRKDNRIKKFKEYSFKVELEIDIKEIPLDEIEYYVLRIIDISKGFLLVLMIACGDIQRKEIVYNIAHSRIQKKTAYNKYIINLLVQSK